MVGTTYAAVTILLVHSLVKHVRTGYMIAITTALALTLPSLAFKISFTAADAPELLYWMSGDSVEWLQEFPLLPIARGIFTILAATYAYLLTKVFYPTSAAQKISRYAFLDTTHSLFTLLLVTQTRTHNIPLYFFFILQYYMLRTLSLTPAQISMSIVIMAYVSFFALGGSNAISSIDLSNAYNGVSGYNVVAVGVLLFLSNWAGPIWWVLGGLVSMASSVQPSESASRKEVESTTNGRTGERQVLKASSTTKTTTPTPSRNIFFLHATIGTVFTSASLLSVMVACTMLRTHLFVWTVFSPKYLYAMAWSLGYHFAVALGLGGGLWWIGGKG
jgi:ethanolaminephosphotransferase